MGISCIRLSIAILVLAGIGLHTETGVAQCANPDTINLTIKSLFLSPTNTGHNFDSTFFCKSTVDSIFAFNKGSVNLKLVKIDIIDQNPTGPPQFFFNNGTQHLTIDSILYASKISKYTCPIWYTPSIEGEVVDSILVTWDSAGVRSLFSSNILIGYGRLDHDSLSFARSLYKANTNDIIDLPINLLNPLHADDQAFGLTFKMTYSNNYLSLLKDRFEYDPTLTTEIPPQYTNDDAGNEIVMFNLRSSVPIINLSPLLTLHFALTGMHDTIVPITISDLSFWGQNPQDTLCYIKTAATNAAVHITDSISIENNLMIANEGNKAITISSNNVKAAGAGIYIFSVLGAQVGFWQGTIAGNFRKTFPIPSSGVYFIKVQTGGQEFLFKRILN
jgi:hypothetical protein